MEDQIDVKSAKKANCRKTSIPQKATWITRDDIYDGRTASNTIVSKSFIALLLRTIP
jgi:hypothetical protein